jgi:monoamine oxidase
MSKRYSAAASDSPQKPLPDAPIPGFRDLSGDLSIVGRGLLPRADRPGKVIIVGAGMAGLVAGYELLRAGHEVVILEAQNHVGGRVRTLRTPFAPGLHAEAGAMRIPRAHRLTLAYVKRFGLDLLPFTAANPAAYYHLFGRRMRIEAGDANPDSLGFHLAEHELGRTVAQRLEAALRPLVERLRLQGETAWRELERDFDQYSTLDFLSASGWSEGAIEMLGVLSNQEALLDNAFLEFLREEVGLCFVDLVQIAGGMDSLPRAFVPALGPSIRLGARVRAVDQRPDSVTVYYEGKSGPGEVSADHVILALPFAVLRRIDILQPFSHAKQRAIRELHYDPAVKVFLQCQRRFWEEDDGIFGGRSVTDLPIRTVYYPEHGRETGRGVLLASYTWGEDAQRWGALPPDERVAQAEREVSHIHPQATAECELGVSKPWQADEYAGGAFADFAPGQQTRLYEHIVTPEGRIHFAGEHASLLHAWIQGAIQSGLRAAREVHTGLLASQGTVLE